jgi:uncharacterized protein (DUF3084 family)
MPERAEDIMSEERSVEQRLAALESQVAELKQRLDQLTAQKGNWIEQTAGMMKDYPEFAEVVRLGAEWRRAQRDPGEP